MFGLKKIVAGKDPKEFAFGLFLIVMAILALVALLSKGYKSYYVTGLVLFTFFGIAMIRKSKRI